MKINKAKMTPEEVAQLEALEKKYGESDGSDTPLEETPPTGETGGKVTKGDTTPATTGTPKLHPEVEKALEQSRALTEQVEQLTKSLEIKDLTIVAKKYEIIGQKTDELATKLYELKKSGGTVYDDFIAVLDSSVAIVEKSGAFGEVGSSRSAATGYGGEIGAKADEIAKAAGLTITDPASIVKAFEQNPELLAMYEAEYRKGGTQ
jgi:hypothetical protein